ncbi:hypothetical protein BCR43DRAFT_465843 [Syncephalastrum racemosum]|uniref:Cytokinin riboside 5'-monophosphate phosphoribohydrolase n=1 Tax=Syncephalastrum racemosum TaxID=13706 RepID=A0A1X2HSY9_SYNRA|nr:hypothetical protein BCR43DRAFT_465843 [Syncephalastrum racemosum]
MNTSSGQTQQLIQNVCVFCGATTGNNPAYVEQAQDLGKAFAENNLNIVYGGGSIGVMGAIAKAVLDNGGKATGVVPEPLFKNGSKQLAETIVVPDMHTRKKTMSDKSDAFVVLPGGFGTMEEMLEMITWSQLNIHSRPLLLLNTNNYFDLFVQWVDRCIEEGFIKKESAGIFVVCNSVQEVLDALKSYQAPPPRFTFTWEANGRSMT